MNSKGLQSSIQMINYLVRDTSCLVLCVCIYQGICNNSPFNSSSIAVRVLLPLDTKNALPNSKCIYIDRDDMYTTVNTALVA